MSPLMPTPFSRTSTAAEVIDGVDLSGRKAIVTGAGSGIGVETARALASAGAEVTLAVRRPQAATEIAAGITRDTGNAGVFVRALDLSDQVSVRAFAAAWDQPLHILVNNAGIMALPALERTAEGWEMQFATNFLGHFALTVGLHEALAAAHGARIVSVSSSGNLISPVVFDDLHFDFRPYDPLVAYGQSKTADALLAVEATRRWSGEGIYANALNPGAIATGLQKHTGGLKTPKELQKTVPQGAATSVLLAASPLLDKVGGRYFEDCNEAATVTRRPAGYAGVAWYALDPANAERLWDTALSLLPG
ncbi:MAG TPA: SDR family NAD(P)-dependent oxidoreductase [Trebonia sp.]|nr:SDR family NAD(P)-dependent oxidoreductase [Trebonia sp.]